jgi:hypothetical protein
MLVNQSHMFNAAGMIHHLVLRHYMSYGKVSRGAPAFALPPIERHTKKLASWHLYQLTGFWPVQFEEISKEMALLSECIICRNWVTANKTLFFSYFDEDEGKKIHGRVLQWMLGVKGLVKIAFASLTTVGSYQNCQSGVISWLNIAIVILKPFWRNSRPGKGKVVVVQALLTMAGT